MAKKKNHNYVLVCSSEGAVFVTGISNANKCAFWDKSEKPLEMPETVAEELAFGLSANFHNAYHIKSEFEINYQPYHYKLGHFEWVWDEDEKEGEQNDNSDC